MFSWLSYRKTQQTLLFLVSLIHQVSVSDKLNCVLLKTNATCSELPTKILLQPPHWVIDKPHTLELCFSLVGILASAISFTPSGNKHMRCVTIISVVQ